MIQNKVVLIDGEQNIYSPDSKVHGANMGPIWCRQDPGGPHVGPMNFAIWVHILFPAMSPSLAQGSGLLSRIHVKTHVS